MEDMTIGEGNNEAVPKKILELMNVPGLTRENVASHLQKYRLYLRRLSGVSQHQNGLNPSFLSPQEANLGSMSSFDGLDLQTLAASGQLPPNSFAKLQAAGLSRSAVNTGMGMQYLEQRNPFNSDASKLRFVSGQQMNNNNTQGDLINGLMSVVEPKELSHLHQSVPSLGSMGLQINEGATGYMSLPSLGTYSVTNSTVPGVCNSLKRQMAQSQSRGQLLNDISGGHSSGTSLPMGQQILPNEMVGRVLPRNVTVLDGRATYIPESQASSMLDFQINHTLELPGNGFHVGMTTGVSSLQPKGMFPDRGSLEVKGPRGFPASYSILNEHPQCQNQEWELQNVDSTFEATQHSKLAQSNINFCSQDLGHRGVAYSQKAGLNGSVLSIERNQFRMSDGIGQLGNSLLDGSSKIKAESMGDINIENMLHFKHFDQEDLMSAILKQQKGVEEVENDFSFNGSSVDDIPV